MVRDHCIFVILQLFHTPFLVKLLFLGWTRFQWYLLPPAKFHLAIAASCFRLLKPISKTKRMVRNLFMLVILHFFHSPFFWLNCCFRANPRSIISPLKGQIQRAAAITSLHLLRQSGDKKRMVRNHHIFFISQLFSSPIFQLNCCFGGEPVFN